MTTHSQTSPLGKALVAIAVLLAIGGSTYFLMNPGKSQPPAAKPAETKPNETKSEPQGEKESGKDQTASAANPS